MLDDFKSLCRDLSAPVLTKLLCGEKALLPRHLAQRWQPFALVSDSDKHLGIQHIIILDII